MPNLDSIVSIINTAIASGQLATRPFNGAKFYSIADQIRVTGEESEKIQPYIIDNDGEGTNVVFNDVYPLQVYHRILDIDYSIADQDYGKPGTTMQEEATMKMIIMGTRSKIKTRPENIMAAVIMDFPKELKPADISTLGMNSVIIEMGRVETGSIDVWQSEYSGTDYSLDPNDYFYAVNYRLICTYNKSCFTLCNP